MAIWLALGRDCARGFIDLIFLIFGAYGHGVGVQEEDTLNMKILIAIRHFSYPLQSVDL
jgi:hypothetical protein